MPPGSRGRPTTPAPCAKRAMLATVSSSSTGLRSLSLTTMAAIFKMSRCQHVERGERVADGAEITADHQQQWDLQRRHPVEHRAFGVERHHDAADALDEQHAGFRGDRLAAERDQPLEVDAAAFARGGEIGRQRRAEAPGRDALDFVGRDLPPERGEQHRRVAGLHDRRIVAAHHRLERMHRLPRLAQIADQPGGDEGLADVGAGRGDEIGGTSALQYLVAHEARKARDLHRRDAAR